MRGTLLFNSNLPLAIPSSSSTTLTGTILPGQAQSLPATLAVTYSPSNQISGPATVATSGTTFSIPVTVNTVAGSVTVTVSAPGYAPASYSLYVTVGFSEFSWQLINPDTGIMTQWDNGAKPYRSKSGNFVTDTVTGILGTVVSLASLSTAAAILTPTGTGAVDYRFVGASTNNNLIWESGRAGYSNSGAWIAYTDYTTRTGPSGQTSEGHVAGTPGLMSLRRVNSNVRGTGTVTITVPRFPNYRVVYPITY